MAAPNEPNPEDVFRTYIVDFSASIGSEAILQRVIDKLYSHDLIARGLYEHITTTPSYPAYEKGRKVVSELLILIKISREPKETLLKICDVLSSTDDQDVKDIATKIKYDMNEAIQYSREEDTDSFDIALSSQEILTRNLQEGYVLLTIIKLILMGPPGVGKTAFKSLLFNWEPVLQHDSTGIASRPVQAVERMIEQDKGRIWEKISAERLLSMLAAAMNVLATETTIISEDIDHNTLSHSSLVEDSSSSTQAATTVQVQPDPLFYSEKIIQEIEKGVASGELYQSTWIYLLDSGGQPHFADVSRAFIRSNTVYTIAIKLTEKLSDRPPFLYSLKGKLLSNPNTDLCMTNLQLIKHFVRSIVSSESGAKSLIFIIGTCSDLYYSEESKMESIAEKNKQLVAELKEFRDYIVFDNEFNDELIHPVNNICEGEERESFSSKLRQKIVDQVNKMKVEIQVPIRWFVFEIMMKDEVSEKGIISLDKCSKISEKLRMKDLMECFEYLDSLSLILYFKCLPNVIFTDPQYLLDMLSNVISVSFICHSYLSPGVHHQLKTKGIFNNLLLDELKSLIFVPSLFEKQDFLTLLTDLCIVAPMNACTSHTDYFIPVVLPEKEKDREELKSGIVEPFLIKFDIGVVPQGVFLNMVVGLLNREHSPKFRIDPDVDQLRNAIEIFSDDFSASVVLIEHFHWIEVYFYCNEEDKCHKFKVALGESISNCAKRLGYDSSKLKFVATVPCQLRHNNGPYSFHPVIVNEESGKINCSIEKRQCSKLSDRQIRCWFPKTKAAEYTKGRDNTDSTVVGDVEMTTPPTAKRSKQEEVSDDDVDEVTKPPITPLHKRYKQEDVIDKTVISSCEDNEEPSSKDSSKKKSNNNINKILNKRPDEDHVIDLLSEYADKYIEFSIALKVGSRYAMGLNGDNNVKLIQVISEWMTRQCSPITWLTIINVVESKTLGKKKALANEIRRWLAKDENFTYYMNKDDYKSS